MKKLLCIMMIIGASNLLVAQFTYLNEIGGSLNDSIGDSFTNVEIINDTIYTYGAYVDTQGQYLQFKKYDANGAFLASNELLLNDTINYYIEYGYSFVKTNTEDNFFISMNFFDGLSHKGLICKVSLNLDTLWTRKYDQYYPYTSYRKNLDIVDGIVLSGEIEGEMGNQVGTMLTKIDYDGNIIWDEVLRPANGDINRNATIINKDQFLIIGGGVRSDGIMVGLLTKTDLNGFVLWEIFYDDSEEPIETYSSWYTVEKLFNGDAVSANSVDYEQASTSPIDWYTKVIINKIDVENDSLFWEHEYLNNYESENGGVLKLLPTVDGGMILLGGDLNGDLIT